MDNKAKIILDAEDRTRAAFASLRNNLKGVQGESAVLSRTLAGLIPALTLGGLAAFAKSGIDAADAMNDMSQRLGVSVKDLASFKLAAEQSGTSLDGVGAGIARLSRSIGDAEAGNKQLAKALAELKITARDPKEAFFQLADAVQRIQDPTKRAALLSDVLGKSYGELVPLLAQGGTELRKLAKQSESFAESMAQLAPDADRFNDQLVLLKTNAAGAATAVLSELVPSLNEYLAVGKEVVENGTLLDKIRFFGLGNASDEMVNRVRINLAASAGWMEKLKQSADEAGSMNIAGNDNAALLACIADGGIWDGKKCVKKKTGSSRRGVDKSDIYDDELLRGQKELAAEFERFAAIRSADQEEWDHYRATLGEVTAQQNEYTDSVESARQQIQDMVDPTAKWVRELERLDQMEGLGLDPELLAAARLEINAQIDAINGVGKAVEKTSNLAEEFGITLADGLEAAIANGEELDDVLKSLEQTLAKMLVRKTITDPLMNFFEEIDFGSIFSNLFPSAKGNVFSGAGISAYSGSIVSKPTVFPFATGIGLMGEAGAEAILPLKRGPDGKLGVEGGGSNVQVNVINNASGTQASASERTDGGTRIIDVVVEQVDAMLGRKMSRGEGSLSGAVQQRYGLNPVAGAYR